MADTKPYVLLNTSMYLNSEDYGPGDTVNLPAERGDELAKAGHVIPAPEAAKHDKAEKAAEQEHAEARAEARDAVAEAETLKVQTNLEAQIAQNTSPIPPRKPGRPRKNES